MVFSTNPINSILFLILIFLNVSILFFILNLDFLGIILIILYVGAIAVLFLFIVMMMNVKNIEKDENTYIFIGGLLFILLGFQIIYVFLHFFSYNNLFHLTLSSDTFYFLFSNRLDEMNKLSLIRYFSFIIFIEYPIFLISSSFLLLLVLISCIFLSNFKTGFSVRKQYNQLSRNYSLINIYIY